MEDNFSIIKINLKYFKECLIKKDNYKSDNKILLDKYKELKQKYNCFNSNYDAKSIWDKKKNNILKNNNSPNSNNPPKNRFYLISNDLTDDNNNKKIFISFLNKITDKNKDVILEKVKTFINDISDNDATIKLLDILWNHIETSYNIFYIDILYLFNKDYIKIYINDKWDSYYNNKKWTPYDYILNNDILKNDEDIYDEYCKYVKWKKNNINIIKAWYYILKIENLLDKYYDLYKNLYEYLIYYIENDNNNYKHIIDIILDEIYIILDYTDNNSIKEDFNKFNLNKLESSSKFIVYNILEREPSI